MFFEIVSDRKFEKIRCDEVTSLVNDMEYRLAVNVHHIYDDTVVEVQFFCTTAESKSKLGSLTLLERAHLAVMSPAPSESPKFPSPDVPFQ